MLIGILSALLAGAMLGLYALPGKYVKDFQQTSSGSVFFRTRHVVVHRPLHVRRFETREWRSIWTIPWLLFRNVQVPQRP